MNRAERRAQNKAQKRVAKPLKHVVRLPKMMTYDEVFRDIEAMMRHIRSGALYCDTQNVWVVRGLDGDYIDVVENIRAHVDVWRALAVRIGAHMVDDAPMVQLANKLAYHMPLTMPQVEAAELVLCAWQGLYRAAPAKDIALVANQMLIRRRLESSLPAQ